MKYKNISFLMLGVVIMGISLVSIKKLVAQELAPEATPLPVTSSEEVQPLTGEQNARTRQQNIRAEQLQRQRSNNEGQNQPIRSNGVAEGLSSEQVESSSNREQRMMDRCGIISSNIARHKERFSTKSGTRIKVYNKIVSRLEVVSNRLGESGVDVTLLNTYISDIKSKVVSLETSSNTYSNSSQSATELCSQEGVKSIIDLKKQELQVIIEQDKEIRRMIRDTVVPYLKTLRPVSVEQSESQTSNEPTNPNSVTAPIQ